MHLCSCNELQVDSPVTGIQTVLSVSASRWASLFNQQPQTDAITDNTFFVPRTGRTFLNINNDWSTRCTSLCTLIALVAVYLCAEVGTFSSPEHGPALSVVRAVDANTVGGAAAATAAAAAEVLIDRRLASTAPVCLSVFTTHQFVSLVFQQSSVMTCNLCCA